MTLIYIYDSNEALLIKKAIQNAFPFEKILIVSEYDAALKAALSMEFDLFVISLEGDLSVSGKVTGVELIKKLRRFDQYKYTDIVLTAEYHDAVNFMNNGLFCCGILDIPIEMSRAEELFRFIIGRRRSLAVKNKGDAMVLTFRHYNKTEFLHPDNIILTEKNERKLSICTGSNTYTMDARRAGDIVERLIKYGFVQVNRSEYVNPRFIAGYKDRELIVRGLDDTVHVTASGLERLSSAFKITPLL